MSPRSSTITTQPVSMSDQTWPVILGRKGSPNILDMSPRQIMDKLGLKEIDEVKKPNPLCECHIRLGAYPDKRALSV